MDTEAALFALEIKPPPWLGLRGEGEGGQPRGIQLCVMLCLRGTPTSQAGRNPQESSCHFVAVIQGQKAGPCPCRAGAAVGGGRPEAAVPAACFAALKLSSDVPWVAILQSPTRVALILCSCLYFSAQSQGRRGQVGLQLQACLHHCGECGPSFSPGKPAPHWDWGLLFASVCMLVGEDTHRSPSWCGR